MTEAKADNIWKRKIFQWFPRHSIKITEFGKSLAIHIDQHHHIFELFLHNFLELSKEEAHEESSEIGSSISCKVTQAITKKLGIKSWIKDCICPETSHVCSYKNS